MKKIFALALALSMTGWGPCERVSISAASPPTLIGVQPAEGATSKSARYAPSALVLKKGSSGPEVRMLQARLNGLVWNVCFNHNDSDSDNGESCAKRYLITVDGRFGKETHEAVTLFQRQQRLGPDGIVGPKTWARLNSPLRPCDAPRLAALALGASEREANFVAYIGFQESRCHLHQVVDRPRTRDYSWGPYGVNYYGDLAARGNPNSTSYIGEPWRNIVSWKSATAIVLAKGRKDGWCHWRKTATQFYCAGPLYGPGDPPPVVSAP